MQIQAAVEQGDPVVPAQGGKHAHLGVFHLAQAAIPLSCHARRSSTFLGKGAFINCARKSFSGGMESRPASA